jgi:hypothetical protein
MCVVGVTVEVLYITKVVTNAAEYWIQMLVQPSARLFPSLASILVERFVPFPPRVSKSIKVGSMLTFSSLG